VRSWLRCCCGPFGAQNLEPLSAVDVGAYIALAGPWASPVSGASLNPARSLGPALAAHILRGPGGGPHGTRAAQGNLGLNLRFTRRRRRMSLQTLPIQRHWMGVGSTSTMALICTHGVASARCWGLRIRYVGVCLTSTGC